jgi:hypothetical protein
MFEGIKYLLCALGDGTFFYFILDNSGAYFSNQSLIQSAITVAKLLLTVGLGYSTVHFQFHFHISLHILLCQKRQDVPFLLIF